MHEEQENEEQPAADFWSDEARILAMVTTVVAGLAMYRGHPATYAESMYEFRLALKALAYGLELPDIRVHRPETEVNVKADRRTSRFVFGDTGKLQNLARMTRTMCQIMASKARWSSLPAALIRWPQPMRQYSSGSWTPTSMQSAATR